MAEKRSNEEIQREILETQLETQRINLDRTKKENALYTESEADRQRKRDQAQTNARNKIEQQRQRELNCKHQQGVGPEDVYGEGSGKSCLTASRVFFSWNWVVQCVWCGMCNQTPHPARKNRKLLPGETAEMRDQRVKLYQEDLAEHNRLLAMARGNKLPPMIGPAWEFTDTDGITVVPEAR